MSNYCIILAAGKGKRMHLPKETLTPKCIYPILNKPMIYYILDCINDLNDTYSYNIKPISVIKYKKSLYETLIKDSSLYAYQDDNLEGNGAAFLSGSRIVDSNGFTLVIPGDKPLINPKTINRLIKKHLNNKNDITIIETLVNKNSNYGRIIRTNNIISEVLEKQNSKFNRNIKYANTSIYCINNRIISFLANGLTHHGNEMYLSEIIKIARCKNYKVESLLVKNSTEFKGVNNFIDLNYVSNIIRKRINNYYMTKGVNIINPQTVTIGSKIEIGEGTIIFPNTFISGNTKIGCNCQIGPNTEIYNSQIGDDNTIIHSLVYDSTIKNNNKIGPFSHLRLNNIIESNTRIGNFVEIKNSQIDSDTKISHLTYVGDATVGKRVNFGCGVVTVNYDGKNKYKTTIKDNVFIGCNSNLIAPVLLDTNSYIAAGSTITNNVPKNAFSIARSYQVNKDNYAIKYPYYKK